MSKPNGNDSGAAFLGEVDDPGFVGGTYIGEADAPGFAQPSAPGAAFLGEVDDPGFLQAGAPPAGGGTYIGEADAPGFAMRPHTGAENLHAAQVAAHDLPLQDDVWGNALAGSVASGFVSAGLHFIGSGVSGAVAREALVHVVKAEPAAASAAELLYPHVVKPGFEVAGDHAAAPPDGNHSPAGGVTSHHTPAPGPDPGAAAAASAAAAAADDAAAAGM